METHTPRDPLRTAPGDPGTGLAGAAPPLPRAPLGLSAPPTPPGVPTPHCELRLQETEMSPELAATQEYFEGPGGCQTVTYDKNPQMFQAQETRLTFAFPGQQPLQIPVSPA